MTQKVTFVHRTHESTFERILTEFYEQSLNHFSFHSDRTNLTIILHKNMYIFFSLFHVLAKNLQKRIYLAN
jgi:hypothetical protein